MANSKNPIPGSPRLGYAYHRIILDDSGKPYDYEFLEVVGAFKKITGLEKETLIGRTLRETIPGIGKEEFDWMEYLGKIACGGGEAEFEYHHLPSGSFFQVHVCTSDKMHFTTVITDITDFKNSGHMAQNERRRLEGIHTGTKAGSWEWNIQTGETIFNERWAEIIGFSLAELAPVSIETWRTNTHHDDLKMSDELLAKHFCNDLDDYECETRMKHKDGHWVWVLDRGKVVTYTAEGKPLIMMGTRQEITDRKRKEELLSEKEKKIRSCFESAPVGVIVVNEKGQYLEGNAAVAKITGYSENELMSAQVHNIIHPDDLALGREHFKKALSSGEATGDFRFIHKDGQTNHLAVKSVKLNESRLIAFVSNITRQKTASIQLNELKNRYQSLFENSLIGAGIATPEGKIVDCNEAFAKILGYTAEELIKLNSKQFCLNPEARGRIVEMLNQNGILRNYETLLRRKDGSFVSVLLNISLIKLYGESYYQTTCLDISEQKLIEESFRESCSLLDNAQKLAHVGGWEWNVMRQTMTWTDETYRIHGMTPGEPDAGSPELIKRSLACYDPTDRPAIESAFLGCVKEGKPYDLEFPLTRIDGQRIWIRTMAKAITKNGIIVKVLGNIQDITETKRNAEALRESAQRLDLAHRAANDVVWDWDIIHNTLQWNAAGTTMFGWTEIVEKPVDVKWWVERILPDDRQRVHDSFFAVVNNPDLEVWYEEYRFKRADGTYADVIDRGYVLRDNQGIAFRMVGAMLDITDRKQAEQVLKESEERYAFLAQTANELVSLTSISDLYAYTARKLHGLLDNRGVVTIVEYNHEANKWKMQHVEGIGKKITRLSKLFGFDIRNLEGEISTSCYHEIIRGKLVEPKFDLPVLLNNRVSDSVENVVKKFLSIDRLYSIAFQQNKHSFGIITFAVSKKAPPINAGLIEAFVSQVSNFVKKQTTEEALNKTERQFSALLESISDSVFVLGREYRHIMINEAATRFVKMTREQVLGNKLADLFPGIEKTEFFKVFKKVMKTREPDIVSSEYTFEDGRKAWYEVSVYPVPEGILCISSDISKRKQTEIALRESNNRLESLLQISQKMVSTSGQKQIIQMIVDNAVRILGLGSGAVYLLQDQETIKLAATTPALPANFPEEFRIASLKAHPHIDMVFKSGSHVMIPDTSKAQLTPSELEVVRLRNLQSNLYLPIRLRKQTIGVLILSSVGELHHFNDVEIRLLLGFANHTAHIIDNSRTLEDLKRSAVALEQHIAERKQAELELQESIKKYQEVSTLLRLMADNMPDMLWAKNLNKEYIFANKAICKNLLNAIDTEEPLGKNDMFFAMRERNSRPDNPQWHTFGEICRDSDAITLEEMKPMQFDELGNVKGKTLVLDVHKAPLYDDNGQLIGVVGSARDVTENKEAEIQLRKLSQVVEQSPTSILITNLNAEIEYVNPNFTEATGYTSTEVSGKLLKMLDPAFQPIENCNKIWEIIRSGQTWKGEFLSQKKNGDFFWESVNISPIKNEKGEITHLLATKEDISTLKKQGEKIRESDEKHRRLVEQMQEGLIATDLNGIIKFVNPVFCELTGYKEHELIGNSGYDLMLRPDDIPKMKIRDAKRMNDISEQYELDIFTKSGEMRTFWFHAVPDKDKSGNVTGSMSTAIDITERKNAQERIRITKDTYQSIFNSVSEAIYVIDESGTFIDVNRGAELMYGYSKEELIKKGPADVSAHGLNDLNAVQEILQEVSDTGISQSFEFWGVRKNGKVFPKEVIINKGKYFGKECIIATARDITRRKEIEKNLMHQVVLRELLMEISSSFINIPLENVDEAINRSLEKMALFVNADRAYIFNYDWENKVGNNTFEWCAADISSEIMNLQNIPFSIMPEMVEAHKQGKPMHLPNVFELPQGAIRELVEKQGVKSFFTIPMMNESHCIGFVGFDYVRDHPLYTETEMQLLKIFAQMLVNVKLRQEMLGQLVVAKEKAEESSRLKTAFLQNLSHEIRTPLNGIIGFSEFINEPDLTPEERRCYTDIIIERGWQLTSIINDVLTISALETKQEELFIEKFNFNKLMREQLAVFSMQAISKGIQLKLKQPFSDEGSMVYSDKAKIGQILNNLFTNSLKFTQEGEIELGCKLKGKMLECYVRDTGIGIDKSKQRVIFERFAQADDSIRHNFGGTGLGLSICKGFVELMGGEIWVDSEIGKGSIFYFTIPYYPATQTSETEKQFLTQNKKITVLVAEDEDTNFMYLAVLLKKLNYTILHATNGQQAVDICRKEPVDLVLMDIKMPLLDGHKAAKIIREFKPQLPIIAQTAHAAQAEIERFRDVFDDYITKPFTNEKIRNTFSKFFDINKNSNT